MPLFSIVYKRHQYGREVYQNETITPAQLAKPIFSRHLPSRGALLRHPPALFLPTLGSPFDDCFGQMQRDEFHLLRTVKNLLREPPLHQNAETAERHSCDNRQPSENRAQDHHVRSEEHT